MKRNIRIVVFLLVIVTVFAFTTTAFAVEWNDYDTWSSGTCLYGFTTAQCVEKSSSQTWSSVLLGLYELRFASTPINNYLLFQPKSHGVYVGDQNYILSLSSPFYDERTSGIYSQYADIYNDIYLRITNPNSGNNMKSGGFWEGWVE